MLIPLPSSTVGPSGREYDRPISLFTCKHLLPSGDCGNYADRPDMCAEFPYGDPCNVIGCEWEAARAGLVPLRRRRLPEPQQDVAGGATELAAVVDEGA